MPYNTTNTAETTDTAKTHLEPLTFPSSTYLLHNGSPLPTHTSPASLPHARKAAVPMEDATRNRHEERKNKEQGMSRRKWFDSFKADQPARSARSNAKFQKATLRKPITKHVMNKSKCGTQVASIDEFNGKPQNLKNFLRDARLYLQTNHEVYNTDATKIAFICSLFTHDAATWKKQIPDPVLKRYRYNKFTQLLRRNFKVDKANRAPTRNPDSHRQPKLFQKKFFVPRKLQAKPQTDKVDNDDSCARNIDQEDTDGNPKETELEIRPQQMDEKLCFKCNKPGHFSRNCPDSQSPFKPSRVFLNKDKKAKKVARNIQRLDVETRDLLLQILRKDFPKEH
jgi:hypothetical protein